VFENWVFKNRVFENRVLRRIFGPNITKRQITTL
jgi:hypothetical protein